MAPHEGRPTHETQHAASPSTPASRSGPSASPRSPDPPAPILDGIELAFTGRLASMSRKEAEALVRQRAGRVVSAPGEHTDLLVVGRGGPPLGDDGRLTGNLRRGRELARAGKLSIISEVDFLGRLGLTEDQTALQRLYTTAQLARMLDVPGHRVRAWVKAKLVTPARTTGRLCWFDFGQVASARVLVRLSQSGVSPARIRKSLEQAAPWLDGDHPALGQLDLLEDTGTLGVRLPDGRLAETSGQLRLGFDGPAPDPTAAPSGAPPVTDAAHDRGKILHLGDLRAPADAKPLPDNADEDAPDTWFEAGIHAEGDGDLQRARACYQRAAELADPDAEICFNLGNTLYALGERAAARDQLSLATRLEPDYVEAWNNLGNVLADLGHGDEAMRSYRRAIVLVPDYADAHVNLAELLAQRGELREARTHWRAYLALDSHSDWADAVRARLAEPDDAPQSRT